MSRTYKHIKRVKLKKFYEERWDTLYEPQEFGRYWHRLKKPGVLPKLRKKLDTKDHWMSTPSWWTRMCMNKPQRRKGSLWEKEVVKVQVINLEDVDKPSVSRRPHIYFW